MASWIQFLVTLMLLFMASVDGATLTRTPTAIELGKTDTLTLRCSSNMVFSRLFVVQILKYVEGLNDQNTRVLAEIAPGEQAKITYSPLVQRATVSGTTTGTRFLQLVIRNIICADGGMYICKFTGQDSSSNQIDDTQSENVTASAQPGEVKMFPRPDFESYTANKTVEMRCTGNVGNPPKSWLWQWKFPSTNSWSTYPYRDQIKDETPVKDSSGCQNTGATVLNYVVRLEDHKRIIRCSLGGNEDYSANKTICITDMEVPTTPKTGGSEEPSTANVGLIVGCTIGALALIVIIIVIVYFVWFRRRNTGENYDTREEDSKGQPHHTAPYMTDNSAYAQPKREEPKVNRRGFVNRGLDDKHANNYANDGYDDHPDYGRTNKAMDDDGGSFGSAV